MNKPTVIIGASSNPERYSFKATKSLASHGHTVYPVGIKNGNIGEFEIITDKPALKNIDTVTLYIGPDRQNDWFEYIASLHPQRVIFNPGTENEVFEKRLTERGIKVETACTLVLLSLDSY